MQQKDLSRAALKVTDDRPGETLVLEGENLALSDFASGIGAETAAGAVGGLLLSLSQVSGQSELLWLTHRLSCDRKSGSLAIDDFHIVTQEKRNEDIRLADIAKLVVRRGGDYWDDKQNSLASDKPLLVEAMIHVRRGSDDLCEYSRRLQVEGIDAREKVADLAYRFGAAIGLLHQRIVSSDPMRIEIEMQREQETGFEPMPAVDVGADYLRGVFITAVSDATATWVMRPFDPAKFPSSTRITKWNPSAEIQFKRPFKSSAIGCLPFSIAALSAGPVFWYFFRDQFSQLGALQSFLSIGLAAVLGLLFGGLGVLYCISSLPRRVDVNWSKQEIKQSGLLRRKRISLHYLTGVELQWIKTTRESSTPYHASYHCVVNVHAREKDASSGSSIEITSTDSFQLQPYTSYDAALPIAKVLADSLAVPLQVTMGYVGPKRIGRV